MNSFDKYLNEPYVLTFEEMHSLHQEILDEIEDDSDAIELYDDLVNAITKYATMRANWMLMSREEKLNKDSLRTAQHDTVITHFNMLARYLRMQGKKAAWRDKLGDEADNKYSRKTIGDFGCYIVFINSLCAR